MKEASKKQTEKELDGWDLLKKRTNMDRTDSDEDEDFDGNQKSEEEQLDEEEYSSEEGSQEHSEQEASDSEEQKSDQLIETDMNILSESELRERINRATHPYFRPIMLDYYIRGTLTRPRVGEHVVLPIT